MTAARSILLCSLALVLVGCAGYRLGPTGGLAAGERSLQVTPFYNQTLEPRLSDSLMSQLRREIQRDGTFELASSGHGDIVLSGVLTRYDREALSFASGDVTTVLDYRLTLTAQVSARDRTSGKLLLEKPINGHTIIRVGNDLVSTERQALPLLTADLARNIVALLADGTW